MTGSQVWDKEAIHRLLATSKQAVARALVVVYNNQTDRERADQQTHDSNGVGFSGVDAEILSSFAQFYLEHKFLTPRQVAIARNKVKKYWRQLLQEVERKGMAVSYKVSKRKDHA